MDLLVFGKTKGFFGQENKKITTNPSQVKNINKAKIKQIVSSHTKICFLKENGTILQIDLKSNDQLEFNEHKFVSIACGYSHFIALSKEFKIYSWDTDSQTGCIGHGRTGDKSTPTLIENVKNINFKSIVCGNFHSLCLTLDNILYGFGNNIHGELGTGERFNFAQPQIVHKNVIKIWSGFSWNSFIQKSDNTLLGFGFNGGGSLGIGSYVCDILNPRIVTVPVSFDDKTSISMLTQSTYLLNDRRLFVCGSKNETKLTKSYNKFIEHPKFINIPTQSVSCSHNYVFIVACDQEIYLLGDPKFSEKNKENFQWQKLSFKIPPNYDQIYVGHNNTIFLKQSFSTLIQDFSNLLKSKEFTDIKISKINLHSKWISTRLGVNFDQELIDYLSKFDLKTIEILSNWIYSDRIINKKILNPIFQKFGIQPNQKTLKLDLINLYNNNNSKDFSILIPIDDGEMENDWKNESVDKNNLKNFYKIKVHKIILIARSNMFRDLFKHISHQEEYIKDFSKKSIEAMQIFIKFLYTDKINLNADSCNEFIFQDLEDAAEYYQLNEKSTFKYQLNKIFNN
ncbi:hypothetical protein M0812_14532 [Anaeramoeba flamelloides]|uniref:BTB domain-containing protein n=1 Tax=Anaeramoeba flamelloides TaxID=1746091 RepID=A0AAV7ZFP3_9EUKA|nr:hypothetical protein M0812_14532 [Anaeramoeba flamelloides]